MPGIHAAKQQRRRRRRRHDQWPDRDRARGDEANQYAAPRVGQHQSADQGERAERLRAKRCLRGVGCQRGGYPKIGTGRTTQELPKANKCTLCYGRAGADADLDPAYGFALPTKVYPNASGEYISSISGTSVPELKHQPSCVFTCPAKSMMWDTKTNITAFINNPANGFVSAVGDGSMYWASRKGILIAPKADPLVEDHVTPLLSTMLNSPFAKAALVPTALGAGLLAVIARRRAVAEGTPEGV